VGLLASVDPDPGETSTFTLLDNAGGRFQITGNSLKVAGPLDREASASHNVIVQVRDSAGHTLNKSFNIGVGDVNDTAPVITSPSSVSVKKNETQVVTLSASDADVTGGPITATGLCSRSPPAS
jgi:hypothetical protein